MPSKHSSRTKKENIAIRNNFTAESELPTAVKDLADLLADIALQRLKTTDQPRRSWPGETQ